MRLIYVPIRTISKNKSFNYEINEIFLKVLDRGRQLSDVIHVRCDPDYGRGDKVKVLH